MGLFIMIIFKEITSGNRNKYIYKEHLFNSETTL